MAPPLWKTAWSSYRSGHALTLPPNNHTVFDLHKLEHTLPRNLIDKCLQQLYSQFPKLGNKPHTTNISSCFCDMNSDAENDVKKLGYALSSLARLRRQKLESGPAKVREPGEQPPTLGRDPKELSPQSTQMVTKF